MRSFFRFTGIGINSAVSVPDVFARITRDVKSWIKGVAHGTQDSDVICSAESRCDDGWTHSIATTATSATCTFQRKGCFTELGASVGEITVILSLFMTSRQKISSLH